MEDHDEPLSHVVGLLVGALALAGVFLWVSNLTAGDEYGGRYDVAVVNYTTWFAFMMAATVAFLLAVITPLRVAEWLWLRRKRRSLGEN